eukprot:g5407.t1
MATSFLSSLFKPKDELLQDLDFVAACDDEVVESDELKQKFTRIKMRIEPSYRQEERIVTMKYIQEAVYDTKRWRRVYNGLRLLERVMQIQIMAEEQREGRHFDVVQQCSLLTLLYDIEMPPLARNPTRLYCGGQELEGCGERSRRLGREGRHFDVVQQCSLLMSFSHEDKRVTNLVRQRAQKVREKCLDLLNLADSVPTSSQDHYATSSASSTRAPSAASRPGEQELQGGGAGGYASSNTCMDLLNETARIWVENHPTLGWCPARVDCVDDDGNYVAVDEDGTQFIVPPEKANSVDPSCLRGVEDLLTLGDFNEGCLLQNIRKRYFEDRIYTGIGAPILVSINPYQKLKDLYSPATMAEYRKLTTVRKQNRDVMISPHLFSVASECYDTMLAEQQNQSIIITGESGAGKTEATKRILNYVANIQDNSGPAPAAGGSSRGGNANETAGGSSSSTSTSSIEHQVLRSNPVLEAFGNAKTVRNDNSSRFGKFIEIQFDRQGKLTTANIRNYLLEKCRITAQQANERNYHAFYLLSTGAKPKMREELNLGKESTAEDFDFISMCTEIEGAEQSDEEGFLEVTDCLARLKFTKEEVSTIWKCCAAILLLGNLDFDENDDSDSSVEVHDWAQVCPPICELLGIEVAALRGVLTNKKFFDPISKNEFTSPLRLDAAKQVKLSIARVLYSRMFDWLVGRINASMQEGQNRNPAGQSGGGATTSPTAGAAKRGTQNRAAAPKVEGHKIGLLDIYGFEVFEWNSFEQLCINFANEKLQQHFNSHMFRMEQKLYSEENISWAHIDWKDNQDVIDALEKKPSGVFPHLDSTCLGPNATDAAFLQALYTKTAKRDIIFNPSKQKTDLFAVAHYAGEVRYSVEGFLDKNYEKQTDEALQILRASQNPLITKFVEDHGDGEVGNANAKASAGGGPGGRASGPGMRVSGRGVGGARDRFGGAGAGGASSSMTTDKIKGPQGTVSSTFREQLDSLVADLNKTHPRYIRCIKPNPNKAAHEFDSKDVLRQLRCAGMLEAIRIRRAGYSVRRPFKEFLLKFGRLHPNLQRPGSRTISDSEQKPLCQKLLEYLEQKLGIKEKVGDKAWQIGRSKVFLKEDLQKLLEAEINAAVTEFCIRIAKMYRGYLCRRRFRAQRAACLKLQCFVRCVFAVRRLRRMKERRKAAVALQTAARGSVARKRYRRMRTGALKLQSRWRGVHVRLHLGDFRELANKRDAERARSKIQREREDAERRRLADQVEAQKREMEEAKKEQAAKEAALREQLAQEAEERRRKENEEREKKERVSLYSTS